MGWDMMGPSRARVSTPGRVRKDNVRFCKVSMISAAIFFIFSLLRQNFCSNYILTLGLILPVCIICLKYCCMLNMDVGIQLHCDHFALPVDSNVHRWLGCPKP